MLSTVSYFGESCANHFLILTEMKGVSEFGGRRIIFHIPTFNSQSLPTLWLLPCTDELHLLILTGLTFTVRPRHGTYILTKHPHFIHITSERIKFHSNKLPRTTKKRINILMPALRVHIYNQAKTYLCWLVALLKGFIIKKINLIPGSSVHFSENYIQEKKIANHFWNVRVEIIASP